MKETKIVYVGDIPLGDKKDIIVQSMLSTPSSDCDAAVKQALRLEKAGCRIIRIAVPDKQSLKTIDALKQNTKMPVVCDIHFDYKLALEAVSAGADKIRINPGNIGDDQKVKAVADACKQKNVPIRIGVNGGSLEKEILKKYGSPTAEALVESAMYHINLLNKFDFDDIVISLKSSNVKTMIEAYRILADKVYYPMHLGVTEAGPKDIGIVKNAIGIGSLLADGIGDTIRVSLTADPVYEVEAGYMILNALGLDKNACQIISCPTCGRCKIDIISLAEQVEALLKNCKKGLKVAVMGCAVNGPGEAKEADIGVAGGNGEGLIFQKGQIIKKVKYDDILSELIKQIEKL